MKFKLCLEELVPEKSDWCHLKRGLYPYLYIFSFATCKYARLRSHYVCFFLFCFFNFHLFAVYLSVQASPNFRRQTRRRDSSQVLDDWTQQTVSIPPTDL